MMIPVQALHLVVLRMISRSYLPLGLRDVFRNMNSLHNNVQNKRHGKLGGPLAGRFAKHKPEIPDPSCCMALYRPHPDRV